MAQGHLDQNIQLRHSDIKTTLIYGQVSNRDAEKIKSPPENIPKKKKG